MSRRILLSVVWLSLSTGLFAQSPAKIYLQVINACGAGPNLKHLVWLGTSNNDGPGSIWTLRDGPRLKERAITYFKSQQDLDSALGIGKQGANPCSSDKAPKWSAGADVPISVSGLGNAEVTSSLTHSATINATAADVSWVSIPTNEIVKAINKLDHKSPDFWTVGDGRSYALVSAYSVKGLQINYTLDHALTIGAKGSIKASPSIDIGSAQNPFTANVSVSEDGQKVTISIPDAHWVVGEMMPFNELSQKQNNGNLMLVPSKNWFTTCRSAGTCN